MPETKNIIILGKEGKKKANLANILLNRNGNFEEAFFEREEKASSWREPYQVEETIVDGITYRIIDLIGLEDEITEENDKQEFIRGLEELAEEIESDGINQIILVNNSPNKENTKYEAWWCEFFGFGDPELSSEDFPEDFESTFFRELRRSDDNLEEELAKNDTREFKEEVNKKLWVGSDKWHGLKHCQEKKWFPIKLENFLGKGKIKSLKDLLKQQLLAIKDEMIQIRFRKPHTKNVTDILLENWDKFRIDQFENEEKSKELIAKIFKIISDDEEWLRFSPEFLEKFQEVCKEKQETFKEYLKDLPAGNKWIEALEKSHLMNFLTISKEQLEEYKSKKENRWLKEEAEKMLIKKSILEITPQDLIKIDKKELEREFKKTKIISDDGHLFNQKVLEFLQLALKGETLVVVYEKNIELSAKEFINDKLKSTSIKIFAKNEVCEKLEKAEKARNVLLVGRTGAGKSSLANLLVDKEVFKTSASSVSETKGYQAEIFEDGIVPYRVIDLIGIGDTQLSEEDTLRELARVAEILDNGVHRVLFVIRGRFTKEEVKAFKMLEAIFKPKIVQCCTIVRTRFPSFQNSEVFEKDFSNLIDEEGNAKPILESLKGRFIYVDNPSIVPTWSDSRKEEVKKTKKAAREVLLKHLQDNSRIPYEPRLDSDFLDRRIREYFEPLEKEIRETQNKIKKLMEQLVKSRVDKIDLKGVLTKKESEKSPLEKEISDLVFVLKHLTEKDLRNLEDQFKKLFAQLKKEEEEKLRELLQQKPAKNILLIGREWSGKSALANVITGTNEFKESAGSVREVKKNVQAEIVEEEGVVYRIIDTVGISDNYLTHQEELKELIDGIVGWVKKEGLNQILFVTSGRFTEQEKDAYNLLETGFGKEIIKYTTIVRTRFVDFHKSEATVEDRKKLVSENEDLFDSSNKFLYVDNPSIITGIDMMDEGNRKIREESRKTMFLHMKNFKEVYRPKITDLEGQVEERIVQQAWYKNR